MEIIFKNKTKLGIGMHSYNPGVKRQRWENLEFEPGLHKIPLLKKEGRQTKPC